MRHVDLDPREYWRGRDVAFATELTTLIRHNASQVLERVTFFLESIEPDFGPYHINSGWRPRAINATVPGSAPLSKHRLGLALDLGDDSGSLGQFIVSPQGNADLERCALWCESPAHTPRWVHFQTVPPKSGRRIFIP